MLRHVARSLITEVYQDMGLKHFMHTFGMPQIDLYCLPLYCEVCAFLILQLNRSMLEHIIDKEWTYPLGFLFAQNKRSLEINHQLQIMFFNHLVVLLFHLLFIDGLTFIRLQAKLINLIQPIYSFFCCFSVTTLKIDIISNA